MPGSYSGPAAGEHGVLADGDPHVLERAAGQ